MRNLFNRSNLSVVRIEKLSVTRQSAFSLPLIQGFVPVGTLVRALVVNSKGQVGDVNAAGEILLFVESLHLKQSLDGIGTGN